MQSPACPAQRSTRADLPCRAHPPPATQPRLRPALKDTDRRGGSNGQDGARGDGLLGIPQVSRAVGASHDAWGKRGWCQGEQSYSPYPSPHARHRVGPGHSRARLGVGQDVKQP